nr:hypothetical protein [uncultured Paraglaciecola sp.]
MNTAKKTIALAHKTLLISIGACDRGREIAANKLDQLFVGGSGLVNDLLEKGESFETQVQAKIEARKMLQGKISALRARFGFGNESRDQQIDMLSQRVDSLIEVVAKLAQQKAAEKKMTASSISTKKAVPKEIKVPAKAAATKSAVAKVAATKPAVAKVAATKPAVAKVAATKPAVAKVAATKPAVAKVAATKPVVDKIVATKPTVAKVEAVKLEAAKTANADPAGKSKVDDKD